MFPTLAISVRARSAIVVMVFGHAFRNWFYLRAGSGRCAAEYRSSLYSRRDDGGVYFESGNFRSDGGKKKSDAAAKRASRREEDF